MTAAWDLHKWLQYGAYTNDCSMGLTQMTAAWDLHKWLQYGAYTNDCSMGLTQMIVVWDLHKCTKHNVLQVDSRHCQLQEAFYTYSNLFALTMDPQYVLACNAVN